MTSMVGSSWKMVEANCEAPMRSPAAAVMVWRLP